MSLIAICADCADEVTKPDLTKMPSPELQDIWDQDLTIEVWTSTVWGVHKDCDICANQRGLWVAELARRQLPRRTSRRSPLRPYRGGTPMSTKKRTLKSIPSDQALQASARLDNDNGALYLITFGSHLEPTQVFLIIPEGENPRAWASEYGLRILGLPYWASARVARD